MAAPLSTRRFTVDEYHRMAEAGVLTEDDRVELLDGQIVPMTPIGHRHAGCVNRLNALLASRAGAAATVSVQNPVVLGEHQEPQPDVALLRYRADGYGTRLPAVADVLLVIEVADTTIERDWKKIPVYARGGVPEVWLVDLATDQIHLHRKPAGGAYADVTTARRGASLNPVALPNVGLSAEEILG
jgi:Uma2 family endonuclease